MTPQQILDAVMRMCECGHGEGFHGISRSGARTACSVIEGARGKRCACKRFREAKCQES